MGGSGFLTNELVINKELCRAGVSVNCKVKNWRGTHQVHGPASVTSLWRFVVHLKV